MKLSTKGRYAVMALVDLASQGAVQGAEHPVTLAEIAERQHGQHQSNVACGARISIDRSDEPVTLARHGLDKSRIRTRVAKRIAQFAHRGIHPGIEIDEGARRPEGFAQFIAGDQLAGTLE